MELFLQELAKLGDRFYLAFVAADRWKLYLSGLGNTLAITLGAICISTVLGMLLCLMKISRYRILRGPAKAYIDVIRGIPVVVQLMFYLLRGAGHLDQQDSGGHHRLRPQLRGLYGGDFPLRHPCGGQGADGGGTQLGPDPRTDDVEHHLPPRASRTACPPMLASFIVLVKETAWWGTSV